MDLIDAEVIAAAAAAAAATIVVVVTVNIAALCAEWMF